MALYFNKDFKRNNVLLAIGNNLRKATEAVAFMYESKSIFLVLCFTKVKNCTYFLKSKEFIFDYLRLFSN